VNTHLLTRTAAIATDWLDTLDHRSVAAPATVDELRARLGGPLPPGPVDPLRVVEDLARAAEPGLVGIPSGRYFGFVIGGGLPAAVAADWLTTVWDQCPALYACGPAASVVEEVAGAWLGQLLGLPGHASFAFVPGCQTAHLTCLAAAVDALRSALATRAHPTIISAQAGEINTGAFDDLGATADAATEAGAWLHVDGAFGLWAAASPARRHLVAGVERADSGAFDAHKWLNVPYDSGMAFCARPDAHRAAMSVTADYLVQGGPGEPREPMDWTPAFSRRARGFAVYAALRSLGRQG
jgi:glutamate/tyrosine decarboxylase-like PLP-dependent enzyme